MLATQAVIDVLAERIERAYRLRRPDWNGSCSTQRVWTAAATVLWEVHEADPVLPLDPEFFVSAQPGAASFPDPWLELARRAAGRRYARCVRKIIRTLRLELRSEVRLAERRIAAGEAIAAVLETPSRRFSALARFIVAHRAGRPSLARRFAVDALEQHRSCPLYREASREFLAADDYPTAAPRATGHNPPCSRRPRIQANLN